MGARLITYKKKKWNNEMAEPYIEPKPEQRSPTEDELFEIIGLRADIMKLTIENKRLKEQIYKLSNDMRQSIRYAEDAKQAYKELYDHETEKRHRKEKERMIQELRYLKEQVEIEKMEARERRERF